MDQPQKVKSLLLAGHRSRPDPLCTYFGVKYKSLILVNGEMMLTYPLKTLLSCDRVTAVTVLTQEPVFFKETLSEQPDMDVQSIQFDKSAETIAGTLLNQIADMGEDTAILITTADSCLLRPTDVEEFIQNALKLDADIAVGFVEKDNLLARYPAAQRTWMRFSDRSVTGCNLFLIRSGKTKHAIAFWSKIETDRKKVLKMAFQLGPVFFLRYWFGYQSMKRFFDKISKVVDCKVKPVYMSDPDIAQDADKLIDIEQIEAVLEKRKCESRSGA